MSNGKLHKSDRTVSYLTKRIKTIKKKAPLSLYPVRKKVTPKKKATPIKKKVVPKIKYYKAGKVVGKSKVPQGKGKAHARKKGWRSR